VLSALGIGDIKLFVDLSESHFFLKKKKGKNKEQKETEQRKRHATPSLTLCTSDGLIPTPCAHPEAVTEK
jgi:hypothetical protein